MNTLEFTALVGAGSFVAGLLGALTGLGGGVVLVPLLALFFKVDIRYAIGASLVSVIATSSGAAAAYVKEGFYSAYLSRKPRSQKERNLLPNPLATRLKMNGSFPEAGGIRHYNVQNVPAGFSLMFGAGTLSGLLGIGSGAVKVLAMDQAMKIPFKVSTTTSNFMIGVTAAASAGIYLSRGYVDPGLAMPVMLGVLAGSFLGSRILVETETKWLRIIFSVVIAVLGLQMLYHGFTGKI